MEVPRGRRLGIVLIACCVLVILHDLQETSRPRLHVENLLVAAEKNELRVLSSSEYTDFDPNQSKWLNITGLQEYDGFHWDLLPQAQRIARSQAEVILKTPWLRTGHGRTQASTRKDFGERYRTLDQLDSSVLSTSIVPFYQNVTGLVRGEWIRSSPTHLLKSNESDVFIHGDFTRNMTGSRGSLLLRLDEKQSTSVQVGYNRVQDLKANLDIEDASGETWDVSLRGIHWVDSGAVLLASNSDRFSGLLGLPFMARSATQFAGALALLNTTFGKSTLQIDDQDPWEIQADQKLEDPFPMPQCEYVIFLQQHFVWPFHSHSPIQTASPEPYLMKVEEELRHPTGMTVDFIPPLQFSATIFSPDCGFLLESSDAADGWYQTPGRHLMGNRLEVMLARVRSHVLVYGLVIFAQLILLSRQIKDASTPSTKSRISYYTIAIQVMADGGAVITSWFMSAFVRGAYLPIITLSFLLFLCVPFLELKFLLDLWTTQAPEREEQERLRQEAYAAAHPPRTQPQPYPNAGTGPVPTVVITPAGADLLPLPATARRQVAFDATPVILPPDQDIDAMIAEDDLLNGPNATGTRIDSPHYRFNLGLKFLSMSFFLLLLSYIASFWPATIRSFYTNIVLFGYLSFWIPQIRRNMLRNCRKALRWEYVLGQSILRLIPIGYFYCYGDNILSVKTDEHMFWFFAAWQWAQILVLLSQDVLGPRFFLPDGILPPAYDYHQVLREGDTDEDGYMPIGFSQDGAINVGESKEKGKWSSDCTICMHALEAPYIPRGQARQQNSTSAAAVTNIFARRDYMITPCRHIFHSQCLDGWMKYKLQCPICRESLPPL